MDNKLATITQLFDGKEIRIEKRKRIIQANA